MRAGCCLALLLFFSSCGQRSAGNPPAKDAGAGANTPDSASETRDTGPLATIIANTKRVLWIGAHPDDENYPAPLLYDMCNRHGASCSFLVVTDGGKGCQLPAGGCGTLDKGAMPPGSIGAYRHAELQNSVAYFGGSVTELAREDTASSTVVGDAQNWNQSYTGVPNETSIDVITQTIGDAITAAHPDVIITFDPRHGVYCQPDHRAVGALAIRAAIAMGFDLSRLLMVESAELYRDANGTPSSRAWVPEDPALLRYDSNASGTWFARPAVMGIHKSQYHAEDVSGLAGAPAAARTIAFLRASDATLNGVPVASPAYDAVCASEDAAWDGHGVCPKASGVGPCF